MELYIFINELSLNQQFKDIGEAQFALGNLLKLLDVIRNTQVKAQVYYYPSKLFSMKTTGDSTIENLFTDRDLKRKFLLSRDRYWESWKNVQLHQSSDLYLYNNENVSDTSVAESYQYKTQYIQGYTILLNFPKSFPVPSINVEKGGVIQTIHSVNSIAELEPILNNLCTKVAKYDPKSQIPPRDEQTILCDQNLFSPTSYYCQNRRIYQRIGYNEYWYVDNLHYNGSAHLEIFNASTLRFLGTCGIDDVNRDNRKINKKDKSRTLNIK